MERVSREFGREIVQAAATQKFHACPACDGRPRVVTTPAIDGNRYKIAANRVRRANGRKKRARGGSFVQRCGVCRGTAEVQFALQARESFEAFDRDFTREEASASATEAA